MISGRGKKKKKIIELDVIVQAFNPSTGEDEAGESRIPGQPGTTQQEPVSKKKKKKKKSNF
jgi:hypothetical protein